MVIPKRTFIFMLILLGFPCLIVAQEYPNSRDTDAETAVQYVVQKRIDPERLDAYNKYLDEKVEEFYVRMRQNVKKYRKLSRKLSKPRYSDPMYFGHRKKPRTRRKGSIRFCRVCGIRH